MSTKPTIIETLVLPTCALSFKITPQTDLSGIGGSITSYRALVGASYYTGQAYTNKGDHHFLARVDTSTTRGETISVQVEAVGPTGETLSDAASVVVQPYASRAAVVRQRVFEILKDAAISFRGESVSVQGNEWGCPLVMRSAPVATDLPAIEVGRAMPTQCGRITGATAVDEIMCPVGVVVAEKDLEVGVDRCLAIWDKAKAILDATTNLSLPNFCVHAGAWSYPGAPQIAEYHNSVGMVFQVSVPVTYQAGEALY